MQTVFDSVITKNYELSKRREWLVTNGLGSYASSTIIGLNTRGYHGLLVAALDPPVKRTLLLSKYEEELEISGRKYLLAVNRYPGTIYPQGYLHLEQFRFERFPVFVYKAGNTIIEKSLLMPYGDNTTITTYKVIETDAPVRISVYPIVNCRDYHSRSHEDSRWNFSQSINPKGTEIRAYVGATTLYLQSDLATYQTTGLWYKNFIYEISAERGLEDREDQYNPGFFQSKLEQGSQISILASLRKQDTFSSEGVRYREMQRLRNLQSRLLQSDPFFLTLANVADTFIVNRRSTGAKSILAGYHWFADWGRDAMISLPGLTLVTKREEEGKEIIRTFLSYLQGGLIPNTFPDAGEEPQYRTIDASLWLVHACYQTYSETGSLEFVREVYPKLQEIISSYVHGTKFGIRVDEDGLVCGGQEGVALTWMDAIVDGTPVTPRIGKPVEISALWYNALRAMERFSKALGEDEGMERYASLAESTRKSFNEKFWDDKRRCLHDVLEDGDIGDGKTRPNQIFSISLPFPVLDQRHWREVLRTVDSELLTPVGLRSLSPFDPEYHGQCVGGIKERDEAYHQGTVWPWLLGGYIMAYLKVFPPDEKTLAFVRELYTPFKKRMTEAGINTISEIYDGDPPNASRGCISQAWSVAEILRSYARGAHQL
ncbi:MAG TPA: amylo-alpha-1,6-glucosidase [Nitrososphaerales archaeon]|nr:amylo-alpha-1,6-glucosidase [Nitrososphaerales archaeon]